MGSVSGRRDELLQGVVSAERLEWKRSVAEWVENSCRAQGIPVKVTDAAVLGQVAVMLGAGRQPETVQTRQIISNRLGSKRVRPITAALTVT